MEDNNQTESGVLEQLCKFYNDSREWITDYSDYTEEFNTEMVERKDSFRNLNGILEDYTVLVLTANTVEQNILTCKLYKEVNANVKNIVKLPEIYADNCVYQFAKVGSINIVHMHPNSTSSFTVEGSAKAVRSALERFRPKLVVSLGVAFGIDPEKQHLGNVLLSSQIIPYDIFNKDTDGDIKLRSTDIFPTHEALNAWDVLMRNPNFSLEEEKAERLSLIKRELKFKWELGTMLSGGSVLSNEKKKRALLQAAKQIGEEKIIGGEMEGVGIYSECKKPDIPCIVIKGICDWGAEKNSWEKAIKIVTELDKDDSEYPTNELIKNCVQAYAMDHATEALFRLLRFDSNFLDAYVPTPKRKVHSAYKMKQKFANAKLYIVSRKKRLFQIVGIFILFLLFIVVDIILNGSNLGIKKETIWLAYVYEFFALVLLIGILIFKNIKELHPLEVHHIWVNFSFDELNFEKCNAKITINDARPIFNVNVTWWISPGKISQDTQEMGNLKGNSSMNFNALEYFNHKTILQIGYELANGDQYVHLISSKRKRETLLENKAIIYCERIFRINGSKDSLIGIKNAKIKDVVP